MLGTNYLTDTDRLRTIVPGALALMTLLALSLVTLPDGALAQDVDEESVDRGRIIYRDQSKCGFCHAWDGRGALVVSNAPAPSLVDMELDRESFVETVRCGRPGSDMPMHFRQAWKGSFECYGLTVADIEQDQKPNNPAGWLRESQFEDLANYVFAVYKNKKMTRANCQKYYGETARVCADY